MDMLVAGVVGGARGLRGEVSLDLRTDRPEQCFSPGTVVTTSSADFPKLTVEGLSFHRGRALVYFEEVGSREEAEAIRGVELLVEPQPEDDAWYSDELAGMSVVSPEGEPLGTVKELRLGAAQDLLVVDVSGREVLVPFVHELVPEVSPAQGTVVVTPIPGLFDEPLS